MYTGLSLEQAPPIKVPFLFFLMAPLGGMLAGAIILFGDSTALSIRWSREWFLVSHLVLLGFNTMVMIGSMFQMLPVVAGVVIQQPVMFSRTIFYTYVAGLIGLFVGFAFGHWLMVLPLLVGLFFALFLFLTVTLKELVKAKAQYDTVSAMKAALLFLLVTVCLALLLVADRLQWVSLGRPVFTDAHLVAGLLGWMGLLIIGISFQVIPMFHITPPYPALLRKWLVRLITASLLCYLGIAVCNSIGYRWISSNMFLGISLVLFAIYCAETLLLLARKKRKVPEATLWFWRQALVFGIGLGVLWIGLTLLNIHSWKMELIVGVNLVYGAIMPIIVGMFLKIVPFLVWFHLQSQQLHVMMSGKAVTIPHMKQIVSEKTVRWLFGLHMASLTLLNGGLWLEPIPINWTGWLPLVFFAALMWVVARAWRLYLHVQI
jgi:hypothetical protein